MAVRKWQQATPMATANNALDGRKNRIFFAKMATIANGTDQLRTSSQRNRNTRIHGHGPPTRRPPSCGWVENLHGVRPPSIALPLCAGVLAKVLAPVKGNERFQCMAAASFDKYRSAKRCQSLPEFLLGVEKNCIRSRHVAGQQG